MRSSNPGYRVQVAAGRPCGPGFPRLRDWVVSCETIMAHAKNLRSAGFSALLLVIGTLSLVFHFKIYHQTSASAFINRPEFYYSRFIIRDSSGQWIKDISVEAGFWSYFTAILSVVSLCWSVARIIVAM